MTTEGALLDGRVSYHQPKIGHRTGIEPVLLAASVPARPGERVVEAGAGAGAGLLCILARVPGAHGLAVELDPGMAALARANFARNGFERAAVLEGDVVAANWGADWGLADHAMANPPWFGAADTPSPEPGRRLAKQGGPGVLATWTRALAAGLRWRGTLTLALPAAAVPEGLAALLAAGCGSPAVLPLWPRSGRSARLVLLRGVRGGAGGCRVLAGLTLHEEDGKFTPATDAILRGGAALDL